MNAYSIFALLPFILGVGFIVWSYFWDWSDF